MSFRSEAWWEECPPWAPTLPSPSSFVCFYHDGLSQTWARLSLLPWLSLFSSPQCKHGISAATQAFLLLCIILTFSTSSLLFYWVLIHPSTSEQQSPSLKTFPVLLPTPWILFAYHWTAISGHSNVCLACLCIFPIPYLGSIAIKPRGVAMPSQWRCLLEKKKS